MLQKVFDFLFGKSPDIFDQKGNIVHKLPKEKWDAWDNRYQKGKDYNWREHKGQSRGAQQSTRP